MNARRAGAAVGLLGLLALSGCSHPPAPTRLRIAHESEAITLDPIGANEAVSVSVLCNIAEPLAGFDRDMRLRPLLAVNWSNPDENTWLIQLRPGVRFHDGRPLTAEDVRFSLERALRDPASMVKGHLASLDEVAVVDEHTVRLHTSQPEPLLITQLAYILITPAARPYDSSRVVGTGPYRFVSWQRGQALETEAFEDYWGGRPPVDHVQFVAMGDAQQALQALRRHEVDVLRWVPETMADQVRTLPGVRLASRPGLATYYLWINARPEGTAKNPLADRKVRQALSLSIDRRAIIRALGGNGVAAHQLVQPGVFGYVSGLPELRHDPEAARALLREAGWPQGFEITLAHRDQPQLGDVAAILQKELAEAGVRLKVETPPWPEIVRRATTRRPPLPLLLMGWRFEDGDAAGFLRDCIITRNPERGWGANNPGFSDPELDALIVENMQTFQESKRRAQYEKLMRRAMDEMPLIPLYHKTNLYAVSAGVSWTPRLDGKLLAAEMTLRAGPTDGK